MRRPEDRHYSEEEVLLFVMGDAAAETGAEMSAHLEKCRECRSVWEEYSALVKSIGRWKIPSPSEESWQGRKATLLAQFREDRDWVKRKGVFWYLRWSVVKTWDYAMENPLPTMGYVAAALAFASERTITVFRLDWILPATGEVIKILRQVL